MSDAYGFELAKERGLELGEIGHELLQETGDIRVWSVSLEPGESIWFHFHHHPYVIISLGGGKNVVESIFGDKRETFEPIGTVVFRNAPSPVHRLTNVSDVPYRSRLVEFINAEWGSGEGLLPLGSAAAAAAVLASGPAGSATATAQLASALAASTSAPESSQSPSGAPSSAASKTIESAAAGLSPEAMSAFKEVLIQTQNEEWVDKSLAGLSHKMLWRNEETGASIALVKFEQGAGIPDSHAHASNQFMYCLSGRYRYLPTGTTLIPGSFYWNPKGSVHGPTTAEETTVLLEIYDGPHYPQRPAWYDNDEDAK